MGGVGAVGYVNKQSDNEYMEDFLMEINKVGGFQVIE